MTDPFGTEALRTGVLSAWAGSPTRFREDANAEEDLLLGGYADRWFVELAQNAADAAQRAGVPGRLLVRPAPPGRAPELLVANTGAALDAAGVAALASLRASTKRDAAAVGRFGVGFAAVLGVTDAPRVVSESGGVAFSAERSAAEATALGEPAPAASGPAASGELASGAAVRAELRRRDGRAPVLRLCWPVERDEPPPPAGYDTEVRLPVEPARVAALLAEADTAAPDLLLALPWLVEITIELPPGGMAEDAVVADRVVVHRRVDEPPHARVSRGGVEARWLLLRRAGELAGPGAAARPSAEPGAGERSLVERSRLGIGTEDRTGWSVCWALPLDGGDRPAPLEHDVLHAPTPSDERLALPARLFATLPMQPSRRRVRTGPATDAILAEAARLYLELLRALPPEQRVAAAPSPGFPVSELDSALRAALTEVLGQEAWLPAAEGGVVAPRGALLLDLPGLTEPASGSGLTELLAEVVPGLLAHGSSAARRSVLTALGVRTLSLAELTDQLAGLRRPPDWWRRLYTALGTAVDAAPAAEAREELAALPVPLVDGRTVTGPRTTVVLAGADEQRGWLPDALTEADLPGLRIVHPDAEHPLLHRLGAAEAGPAELLDHPSVSAAVDRSVNDALDGVDTTPLVRLVLGLVAQLVGADGAERFGGTGGDENELVGEPSIGDVRFGGTATGETEPSGFPGSEGGWLRAVPGDHGELAEGPGVGVPRFRGTGTGGIGTGGIGPGDGPGGEGGRFGGTAGGEDELAGGPGVGRGRFQGTASSELLATRPWLAGLALPDCEGEPCRADELMLSDAVIAPLLVDDAPIAVLDERMPRTYSRHLLTSVGVLDSFALVVDESPTGPDHDLAGEEAWWDGAVSPGADDGTNAPEPPSRVVAVRDLDLVRDDAWPAVLAVLAGNPAYRPALWPAGDGRVPYTVWWLADAVRLGGRRPAHWRLDSASWLAGLFDPVPESLADRELLTAIGVRDGLTVRGPAEAADLLSRLADPDRAPDAALHWAAHTALADAVLAGRVDPAEVDPPERLLALDGSVVEADRAVLLDRLWLMPALSPESTVPGPLGRAGADALAELLDVATASEVVAGQVCDAGSGEPVAWSALPEVVACCAELGVGVPEGTLIRHEQLVVEVTSPEARRVTVPVWRQGGEWHAADPVRALVSAIANTDDRI
jgi:hypothetical protein